MWRASICILPNAGNGASSPTSSGAVTVGCLIHGWMDFSCFCASAGAPSLIPNSRMPKDGPRCPLKNPPLAEGKGGRHAQKDKEVIMKPSTSQDQADYSTPGSVAEAGRTMPHKPQNTPHGANVGSNDCTIIPFRLTQLWGWRWLGPMGVFSRRTQVRWPLPTDTCGQRWRPLVRVSKEKVAWWENGCEG